jgi:hypothetical protein
MVYRRQLVLECNDVRRTLVQTALGFRLCLILQKQQMQVSAASIWLTPYQKQGVLCCRLLLSHAK